MAKKSSEKPTGKAEAAKLCEEAGLLVARALAAAKPEPNVAGYGTQVIERLKVLGKLIGR